MEAQITEKTSVSLKVVMIIATIAVAYGVLTATVMSTKQQVDELGVQMADLDDKFDKILIDKSFSLNQNAYVITTNEE